MTPIHWLQGAAAASAALVATTSIGESLWWNNAAASYPTVFVTEPPAGAHDLAALRAACGEPLDVAPHGVEGALVRCGTWWPARSVWVVSRAAVAPALTRPLGEG